MRPSGLLYTLALCLLVAVHTLAAQPDESRLLLSSEIDLDPPGRDETGEWVELVCLGVEPLPLDDYKVGDEEQLGGSE